MRALAIAKESAHRSISRNEAVLARSWWADAERKKKKKEEERRI